MVKISLKFYIIVIEYQHKIKMKKLLNISIVFHLLCLGTTQIIDQQQSYYYDKITKKERYEK